MVSHAPNVLPFFEHPARKVPSGLVLPEDSFFELAVEHVSSIKLHVCLSPLSFLGS